MEKKYRNLKKFEQINGEWYCTCRKCGKKDKIENFITHLRHPLGHDTICKECKKIADREYHQKIKNNPEKWAEELQKRREWKRQHREDINRRNFEYNSRPEVKERKNQWAKDHCNITVLTEDQYKLKMWRNAKYRAEKYGFNFNIEVSDIIIPKVCPILKTEIILNKNFKYSNPEHTPSLDKIIPEKGYVKGNIRVISFLANTMKQNASKDLLLNFALNIENYLNSTEEIVRTKSNIEDLEVTNKE